MFNLKSFPGGITDLYQKMSIGLSAQVSQTFDDVRKKQGKTWEASREVLVTSGQRLFTVISIGSLPIHIRNRALGATGAGVTGKVYAIDPADVDLVGAVNEDIYNKHANSTATPEFSINLIDIADLNNGVTPIDDWLLTRKIGADDLGRTNAQNQGTGYVIKEFNSDRYFDPNLSDKLLLLELVSHDAQYISSYLAIYEGPLDFQLDQ